MIYVTLSGGIGNQMFQYALARRFSIEYKQNIAIDLATLERDPLRTYKLDVCNLPMDYVEIMKEDIPYKWNRDTNYILKILLRLFPRYIENRLKKKNVFIYMHSDYMEIVPNPQYSNIYFNGWWQSEKYFQKYSDVIRNELRVQLDKRLGAKAEIIKNNPNSVCVHYRKGDYKLKKNKRYQVCDTHYFQNAIAKMRELLQNPLFYIFSDDIEEVKKEWKKSEDFIYIDQGYSDTDELGLMCACNHFIISNSSYSWWGQYLCENSEKRVVAPKAWTNDDRKIDLYLSDWILL